MLWALYGLLHSLLRAAFAETNRAYKIDGRQLAFGQALAGLLFLVPFIPLMTWPSDPHFYRAAVGVALIFSLGNLLHLNLSAQKAGRVSSIYMPLEALAATLIWIAVTPALIYEHQNNMLMTISVVVAFFLSTIGLVKIRPQDINLRAFLLVAPLGLTYAVAGTVTKTVMSSSSVFPDALAYALISFSVMTVVTGLGIFIQGAGFPDMRSGPVIKASLLTGLVSACAYTAFVVSVALAPNPGYTSMLAMLLPVWLLVWHGIIRVKDRASGMAAMLIVIGSCLLMVAAW
jgi:hypothetical protein